MNAQHALQCHLGFAGGVFVHGDAIDHVAGFEVLQSPSQVGRWMRYIVEHGQTTGSKQNTVLSGYCAARRFTKLISVPTAMADPAGALAISLTMYAVEPVPSAASTTCIEHSGCTITLTPGMPCGHVRPVRR